MGTAKKEKIVIILGPTAVGKSDLAVKIAQKVGGEIISADSRQVYRGLDIGTGKITSEEMEGVPHHLLDVAGPKDTFDVATFKKQAEEKIKEILKKKKLPIIVGGTGFYIDALLEKVSLPEAPANQTLRKNLETKNTEELYEELVKRDPRRASGIDKHNRPRLIRALEIIEALGAVPEETVEESPYDVLEIGLDLPKEKLDEKITLRLEKRLAEGLLEEVVSLHENGLSWERMDELGLEYRFISKFLQGETSKEEMIEKLTTAIKQYAKRQRTYFKRNKDIKWFSPKDTKDIEQEIAKFLL